MSVHYKFKSALDYDTINFDGLHISVKDLKSNILQAKRIGKSTDFDLQVTNAQTKEVYTDDEALIPKNTSLLIARIPLATQSKSKSWEGYGGDNTPPTRMDDGGPISKAVDLSSLDASEDDKIRAMMSQSTQDYDPSNYVKIRGANQVGAVPPNYRCYKCHQTGHWIKDCPLSQGPEPIEIKKSTGIPRSFMIQVEGPQVLGAMMTPNGSYAVPLLDHQTYNQKKEAPAPVIEEKPEIPEDLVCSICTDLLTDAVMIPCCGISFCDECIRSTLLETDDHECPDCHERNISPGTLIPNRYLRNSVFNFKNTTGYIKKPMPRPQPIEQSQPKPESAPSPAVEEKERAETPKIEVQENTAKSADVVDEANSSDKDGIKAECPPGISPKREASPKKEKEQSKSESRSSRHHGNGEHSDRNDDRRRSPNDKHRRHHARSPDYNSPISHEERAGTPTVDEPGVDRGPSNSNYQPNSTYSNAPPGVLPPIMNLGPPPHLQGPQSGNMPSFPPGQPPPGVFPPTSGPPPNYRLPPPGAVPPQYMPGPYNAMPRPVFDPGRPPITGPPPYQNYHQGGRSRSRDFQSRNMRGRTPPRVIDDPLEAFNRMLREKDERERRARARKGRSYSRSSSRSYSRSPRRMRSRSPRRRSRSRSFSMSRSRSRSDRSLRDYSPRPPSPRGRRPPSRFRSPVRSPPRYRYKDGPQADRNRDRDYDRDGRGRSREYSREERYREDYRDGRGDREREREYHYKDSYDNRGDYRSRSKAQWGQGNLRQLPQEQFYQPEMHQQPPYLAANRYQRDYPGYANKNIEPYMPAPQNQHVPSRKYDDVAPPGIEQPPIPGEEPPTRYDDRYSYDRSNPEGQEHEQYNAERDTRHKDGDRRDRSSDKGHRDDADRKSREKRHDRFNSRSPSSRNARNPSPNHSKDKHDNSPDKHKRKRHDSNDTKRDVEKDRERDRDRDHEREKESRSDRDKEKEREKDKHHRKDNSDDEKSKRSKDKKKKKEKKDSDKKKRRAEKEERREKKHKRKEENRNRTKETTEESNDEREEKHIDVLENKENKVVPLVPAELSNASCDDTRTSDWENDIKTENGTSDLKKWKADTPPDLHTKHLEHRVDNNNKDKDKTRDSWEFENNIETKEVENRTPKENLYDDIIGVNVEKSILENYGKSVNEKAVARRKSEEYTSQTPEHPSSTKHEIESELRENETTIKEYDDVLDLHTNEAELKVELEKNEMLAPMPEISKWELEDDLVNSQTLLEMRNESKLDKSGKVTNEVLKRAENAIFAKAINAIRPIEIKKISLDRAKLYSGEKDNKRSEESETRVPPQVVASQFDFEQNLLPPPQKEMIKPDSELGKSQVRLSVKERLGVKVDDLDRIVRIDRNKSRSLSPFSKRHAESEERRRFDNNKERHRPYRNPDRVREPYKKEGGHSRRDEDPRKDRSRDDKKHDDKRDKRRRSTTPTDKSDKHKKSRDKKIKRDKPRKSKREEDEEKDDKHKTDDLKPKLATDRRKPTLDEANFEPDYDLETESEKEDDKKAKQVRAATKSPELNLLNLKKEPKQQESSSSDSSDSSSDDERKKKKKHKKHKKRSRKYSTSSSSDSDSDSSDEDHKRKRKHKKSKKKRKKSKHK